MPERVQRGAAKLGRACRRGSPGRQWNPQPQRCWWPGWMGPTGGCRHPAPSSLLWGAAERSSRPLQPSLSCELCLALLCKEPLGAGGHLRFAGVAEPCRCCSTAEPMSGRWHLGWHRFGEAGCWQLMVAGCCGWGGRQWGHGAHPTCADSTWHRHQDSSASLCSAPAGLDPPRGLFQPKQFHGSMTLPVQGAREGQTLNTPGEGYPQPPGQAAQCPPREGLCCGQGRLPLGTCWWGWAA